MSPSHKPLLPLSETLKIQMVLMTRLELCIVGFNVGCKTDA